jgi:hypothetical protein
VTDGVMVGILLGEGWELYIVTDGVMVGILLGEGWELYIVTDGVMVGILLGEGSQCEKRVLTLGSFTYFFYFFIYFLDLLFPTSYKILFWEFYFLPFYANVQTDVNYVALLSLLRQQFILHV